MISGSAILWCHLLLTLLLCPCCLRLFQLLLQRILVLAPVAGESGTLVSHAQNHMRRLGHICLGQSDGRSPSFVHRLCSSVRCPVSPSARSCMKRPWNSSLFLPSACTQPCRAWRTWGQVPKGQVQEGHCERNCTDHPADSILWPSADIELWVCLNIHIQNVVAGVLDGKASAAEVLGGWCNSGGAVDRDLVLPVRVVLVHMDHMVVEEEVAARERTEVARLHTGRTDSWGYKVVGFLEEEYMNHTEKRVG